jgi:hypothetical protein
MDREELVSKLQGLNSEWTKILRQHGAHEPDWEPLEKVLPLKWCGGFMFMGYIGDIRLYKHGLTRRYINIDSEGRCYKYLPPEDDADIDDTGDYFRTTKTLAIKHVFDGLKEMGYKRTTKCTPEVMAERRRRMEEAGWNVVVMSPEDEEI